MTAAASALADDQPASVPWNDEAVARRIEVLDRLIEIGLRIIEPLPDENRPAAERANAFAKISRAIRLCMMLQNRLLTEPQPCPPAPPPGRAAAAPQTRPADDLASPKEIIERELEGIERMDRESPDRLSDQSLEQLIATHGFDDLVAMICQDLGLPNDWPATSNPPPLGEGDPPKPWRRRVEGALAANAQPSTQPEKARPQIPPPVGASP